MSEQSGNERDQPDQGREERERGPGPAPCPPVPAPADSFGIPGELYGGETGGQHPEKKED